MKRPMNTPEQLANAARLAASVMYSRARSAGHHGAQGNEKGARRSAKEADKKTAELRRLIDELRAMAEAQRETTQ
jgi:hypothetical protein